MSLSMHGARHLYAMDRAGSFIIKWRVTQAENEKHTGDRRVTGYYFRHNERQLYAPNAFSWTVGMGACLEPVYCCFMPSDADDHNQHYRAWLVIAHAPTTAVGIAAAAGFAWGFGALMFGQSVSAIGISLANTLVLAISSALGSLLPILLLAPRRLFEPAGRRVLEGVAIEVVGIVFCGYAGGLREKASGGTGERGDLVGTWSEEHALWGWHCCWLGDREFCQLYSI
jgi:hypothetical protein